MARNKVSVFSYSGDVSQLRRTVTRLLKPLASTSPLADPARTVPRIMEWMDGFHCGFIEPDPSEGTMISQAMAECGMTPTGYAAEEMVIYLLPGDWRAFIQHQGNPEVMDALVDSGSFTFLREVDEDIVSTNPSYKKVFLREGAKVGRGIKTRSEKMAGKLATPEGAAQLVSDWVTGLDANDHEELNDRRGEAAAVLIMGQAAGELQRENDLPLIAHQAPAAVTERIISVLWDYNTADLLVSPVKAVQGFPHIAAALLPTATALLLAGA